MLAIYPFSLSKSGILNGEEQELNVIVVIKSGNTDFSTSEG
jgi:hypothetical protein